MGSRSTDPIDREERRIREAYARRDRSIPSDRYALHRAGQIHIRASQLAALAKALEAERALPFGDRRVLEVGCGSGQWLVDFETMGAARGNLAGIDLDEARIAEAKKRLSEARGEGAILAAGADLRAGSAASLPWAAESFDIVFQSTLFTSVLDAAVKRAIAAEMMRVVKPSGLIVWYDFRFDNPFNADVRGVGRAEIERLFPGFHVALRRVTLLPPLARGIARFSAAALALLEGLTFLNTHYLGTLRRR
jgi:SAM-dependent methyltransferase